MNRRPRTALTVLAVMCVVAAAACAGIWHYHDDMGRYLVRRAIANAAAAPQPPAATESDYPTLPLESVLTHAPTQPLATFPLTERTWGDRFNPGGNLPDTGYAAWYFDSDDPAAAAVPENSAAIALNYEYNERYHTPAARLGAYWAGKLHVPEKGRYVFLPNIHQGRVRVLLDRHVLLADTAPGDLAAPVVVELDAGDYRLETEYLNFNWRAARFQLDILANPAIFDSARLTALIAALKPAAQPEGIRAHLKNYIAALQLPANSENYAAALHGALGDENRAILHAPPGDAPYILWLAGEHAVNWHIEGRQPQLVIHNARSHVAADIPALIWTGAFSQRSDNARCHCGTPQGWRCDIDAGQNLTALAAEIQRISGQPLRGFAHDLRSSQLHLEPQFARNTDAIAAQQTWQQQQAEWRENCTAAEAPPRTAPAYDRNAPSLAAWPLVTDGWGAQLNPGDAVPAAGFAVWYRDRRAPQRTFTETTDRIYLDSPKYGIADERLDAYWAGKIHVPEAGAYQPVSKTTPAELRILLNKHDLSAHGGENRPLHLEAGDYLLEAEYRSHDEQAGLSFALVRTDDGDKRDDDRLAAAIAAKNLPANTVAHAAVIDVDLVPRDQRFTLRAPRDDRPYILFLDSHVDIDWTLQGRAPLLVIRSGSGRGAISGISDDAVLHWTGRLDESIADSAPYGCGCDARGLVCRHERRESLRDTARRIKTVSGFPLKGVSNRIHEDSIAIPQKAVNSETLAIDDSIWQQLRALRHSCERKRHDDLARLMQTGHP